MPLRNGKPHRPNLPEKEISNNKKVFWMKETGEVFSNYDDYIKAVMVYSSQTWACAYTRKSELSYAEALESEALALKRIANLTEEEKTCLTATIKTDNNSSISILLSKCIKGLQTMHQRSNLDSGSVESKKNDLINVDDSSDKENSVKQTLANSQLKNTSQLCKSATKLPSSAAIKIFINWYRHSHSKATAIDKPKNAFSKSLASVNTNNTVSSVSPTEKTNVPILQNKIHPFFSSTPKPKSPTANQSNSVVISSSDSEADLPLSTIKENSPKKKKSVQKTKKSIQQSTSDGLLQNGGVSNSSAKEDPSNTAKKSPPKIDLSSSDSESDVPLAKLCNSPKQNANVIQAKVSSGGQQVQLVIGKKLTQKTLFEIQTKFAKPEDCMNQKSLHSLFPVKPKTVDPNQAANDAAKAKAQVDLIEKSHKKKKKIEDLEVEKLKPLPPPKPVEMPEGLSGSFGDVMMIVEFIHTFGSFLLPNEKFTVTADEFKKALGNGEKGFAIVSKVLLLFLNFLLADEEDSKVPEYDMSLVDLPLTVFTMSDVLYHFLRVKLSDKSSDESDEEMADELEEKEEERIPQSCSMLLSSEPKLLKGVLHELKAKEFYTLPASHQLMVIVYLYNEIMMSDEFAEEFKNAVLNVSDNRKELGNLLKERKDKQTAEEKEKMDKEKIDNNQKLEDCLTKQTSIDKEVQDVITSAAEVTVPITPESPTENVQPASEPISDLAQLVRQRRILSMKQIAWKEEQEKKDKERWIKKQEQMVLEKKIDTAKDNIKRCADMLRVKPLGQDRYHRLYWLFQSQFTGIYIEDGWSYNKGDQRERNSWYCIESVNELDSLLSTLTSKGKRESALKGMIKSNYESIIKKYNKRSEPTLPETETESNAVLDSINALKEDTLESGQRIIKGTLGTLNNFDLWKENIAKAETKDDLIPLILELQASVFENCLQGNLKNPKAMTNWVECMKSCKTLSALHSLLGILENCIKWESSIENAKCKVCRKNASDAMAICDSCNHVYHVVCLRTSIDYVPPRGWKCNICEPTESRRRRSRTVEIVSDNEDETKEEESDEEQNESRDSDCHRSESDEDEEDEHDSDCFVCQEGGDLICCDTCPKVYHLSCHEPPIRRLPRGAWSCFECRCPSRKTRANSKAQIQKAGKPSRSTRANQNSRKSAITETESEGESPASKGKTRNNRNRPRATNGDHRMSSNRNTGRSRRKVVMESSDESSDDSERGTSRKSENDENSSEEDSNEEKNEAKTSRKTKRINRQISCDYESEERPVKSQRRAKRKVKQIEENNSNEDSDHEIEQKNKKQISRKTKRNLQRAATSSSRRSTKRSAVQSTDDEADESSKTTPVAKKARVKVQDIGKLHGTSNSRQGRKQRGNYELTACENVINGLRADENAWPFLEPVNPDEVSDYAKFVTNPIDLKTIKDKLDGLIYEDAFEFIQDVKLLFENSKKYNQDTSDVGTSALALEKEFQRLMSVYLPQLASVLSAN